MRILRRVIDALIAVTVTVQALSAQQVTDSTFDTRVTSPAYTRDGPRVLIDEAHFNFHTAGGRYKTFADLVASDGYSVSPNTRPFTADALVGVHVLVIANARDRLGMDSSAFTPDEIDAVHDWVRRGGALLLVADHQPYGASAAPLAQRFGVCMQSKFTIDSTNYDRSFPTSFGDGRLGIFMYTPTRGLRDHAITLGRDSTERITRIQVFTGQSMAADSGAVLLALSPTAIDIARDGTPSPAAGRVQGVAIRYGQGRVVMLGEAGMLTAQLVGRERIPFGMNVPGLHNRQFTLNVMHWLSGVIDPPMPQ